MRWIALLISVLVLGATGCVERRIFITSDPPGALVHVNDVQVGHTPVEVEYTYHGTYDVRLQLPGYLPLSTWARTKLRAHELPVLDVVALALPVPFKSHNRWHFTLEPSATDADAVALRAQQFRDAMSGGGVPSSAPQLPTRQPDVIDATSDLPIPDSLPETTEDQEDN